MINNVNLIAFGTFGNPNGFTQTFFSGNPNIRKSVKTFDIRGPILVYPKSKLYSIRKEYKDGYNMIAYSIYTYAQEPTSARGGSFIGSSILFINKVAEENITINCLNEFHNNLKNKNIQNNTIVVNHSDNFSVSKPKDFDKINFNLREIENLNFAQITDKQLVVYCETNPNKLQSLLKKAIDLLNVYDTIYFTESSEVAEFVHHKNIFQLVKKDGFEAKIQKLAEERLRKIQASIDEFSIEKQRLEEDRKRLIEEYKNQLEQNEKQHQENKRRIEESKTELSNINQKYEAYSKKIEESINRLKGGEKLDNVKQLHNENKRIFIDSINKQQKPNFLNSIPKPDTITNLGSASGTLQTGHSYDYIDNERHHRSKRDNGIDTFKVATFILLLLWIGTMIYFLSFDEPEKEIHINEPQQGVTTREKDTIKHQTK